MPTKNNVINLASVSAALISSRDISDRLRKVIDQTSADLIEIDFSKIEFISRSAAHELLLLKEDLSHKIFNKKELDFTNTSPEVQSMLRAVAANRASPKSTSFFEPTEVDVTCIFKNNPAQERVS